MIQPQQQTPKDEAFAVLALHNWDALEAVRTVLAERDAVEERLRFAALVIGRGFTRGWKP
jgi:predicted nucleotidyltransferase